MPNSRPDDRKETSAKAIKRAYKKGTILEWDKEVTLDDYVLNLAIKTLGRKRFVRVVDRWPEEVVAGLKEKLLEDFNDDFFGDGANYQARERYAWVFGNLQMAVFANKAGKLVHKDNKEAHTFADFLIGSLGPVALGRISFQKEVLELFLKHMEYAQIPTAGLVWDINRKEKARRLAKKVDQKIYKKIAVSELWYVDVGEQVPDRIKDQLTDGKNLDTNINILKKYDIKKDNIERLMKVEGEVVTKKIPLENFMGALKNEIEGLDENDISSLALEFSRKRFWPLRDWLGGVESLIKELGGEIPKNQPRAVKEGTKEDSQQLKSKSRAVKEVQAEPSQDKRGRAGNESAGDTSPETAEPKGGQNSQEKILQLPLAEAQRRFEAIEDQPISSEPIELEGFDEPVKPTVSNWLEDYKDKMEVGYHDNMQRHNFLFRTANGKKLDESDRMIVSAILKSHDEREALPIDPETGKIVLSELAVREDTETQTGEGDSTDGEDTEEDADTQIREDTDAQMGKGTDKDMDARVEVKDKDMSEDLDTETQEPTEDKDRERASQNTPTPKEAKPNLNGNVVDLRNGDDTTDHRR